MKPLLEQLYFSEIIPNTAAAPNSAEYNKLIARVFSKEEYFHNILEGDERKAFQSYMEDQSEVNSLNGFENFANGFRLGVRLLLEALEQGK